MSGRKCYSIPTKRLKLNHYYLYQTTQWSWSLLM